MKTLIHSVSVCRWTEEGGAAFKVSRHTAATIDDLIPKAPAPLWSHQALTHRLSLSVSSVNIMITSVASEPGQESCGG